MLKMLLVMGCVHDDFGVVGSTVESPLPDTQTINQDQAIQILGLNEKGLDTKKIQGYLSKHPSLLFPDSAMGDIKTYFSHTGMFQYLAVLYGESRKKEESKETMNHWEKKAISARNTLVSKLGQVVSAVVESSSSGGMLGGMLTSKTVPQDNPVLRRNIEYLIGAIWFLDHREEVRKLTDPRESLSKTLEIFEQMLNLILEPGFGDNVGIQYNEISSKCVVEYNLGSVPSGESGRTFGSFMGSKSTPQVATGKYKAVDSKIIPALMAYEAVAENRSMRVRRGADGKVKSDYLEFKKAVDAVKKSIAGETKCDRSKLDALSTFADTVMKDTPESVLELKNLGQLTAVVSARSSSESV